MEDFGVDASCSWDHMEKRAAAEVSRHFWPKCDSGGWWWCKKAQTELGICSAYSAAFHKYSKDRRETSFAKICLGFWPGNEEEH